MFVISLILAKFLVYVIILLMQIPAVFFPAIRIFSDCRLGVYVYVQHMLMKMTVKMSNIAAIINNNY